MKKILFILMTACFVAGCKNMNSDQKESEPVEEPENSVAKDATWDYHLIGQWHFTETGNKGDKASKYTEGIEVFHADGTYECYTQNAKGTKVLINGTWKLDDEKDFVVWVTQESMEDAKGNSSDDEKRTKYTFYSIAPEESITYLAGKAYRQAEWVAD